MVSSSNIIFSSLLEKAAGTLNCRASDLEEIYLEVFHTRRSREGVVYAVEVVDARFTETLKCKVRNISKLQKTDDVIKLPYGLSINVKDVFKDADPQSDGTSDEERLLRARDDEESDLVDSGSSDDGEHIARTRGFF